MTITTKYADLSLRQRDQLAWQATIHAKRNERDAFKSLCAGAGLATEEADSLFDETRAAYRGRVSTND